MSEGQASFDFHGTPEQERRFAEFDAANPQVWTKFQEITRELIRRGFQHYGARDVLHIIRWETGVHEDGESGFKINNIWSPWYARKWARTYPQHAEFFRTRRAKADQEAA